MWCPPTKGIFDKSGASVVVVWGPPPPPEPGPAWPGGHLSKVKRVAGEISGAPATARRSWYWWWGKRKCEGPRLPMLPYVASIHSLPPWRQDQCRPCKSRGQRLVEAKPASDRKTLTRCNIWPCLNAMRHTSGWEGQLLFLDFNGGSAGLGRQGKGGCSSCYNRRL